MRQARIEKFSLMTIADALSRLDVREARLSLSSATGAAVNVSGRVRKIVRRDERCGLVIEPGDRNEPGGLIIFADCKKDAKTVKARKIRKGSLVLIRGKFSTFGTSAVCLSDCRLRIPEGELQMDNTLKK